MKYGFAISTGTATQQIEIAILADQHGWDGVFVWEGPYGIDAWTLLGAMATQTSQVRLGTMLTPLPWRRPWKVASQALTLDQLSNGRVILAVGLGAVDPFMGTTGEELDRAIRAEMMDEGIDLIRNVWSGGRTFAGKHYSMDISGRTDLADTSQPVQSRLPIWVVGAWPGEKSMSRVLRCDGVLPNVRRNGQWGRAEPADVAPMLEWLQAHGGAGRDFDFVAEGSTPAIDPGSARQAVQPFLDAGATWWLEAEWGLAGTLEEQHASLIARVKAGPPV